MTVLRLALIAVCACGASSSAPSASHPPTQPASPAPPVADVPRDAQPARDSPSGALVARILRVEVAGNVYLVTVDKGARDGVTTDWRACLADDNDRCVAGGDLQIMRVEPDRTSASQRGTLMAPRRVRLEPPP